MKKLLNLKNIAIALLIVIVVFQQCGGNKKTTGEIVKVDGKKYELINISYFLKTPLSSDLPL